MTVEQSSVQSPHLLALVVHHADEKISVVLALVFLVPVR